MGDSWGCRCFAEPGRPGCVGSLLHPLLSGRPRVSIGCDDRWPCTGGVVVWRKIVMARLRCPRRCKRARLSAAAIPGGTAKCMRELRPGSQNRSSPPGDKPGRCWQHYMCSNCTDHGKQKIGSNKTMETRIKGLSLGQQVLVAGSFLLLINSPLFAAGGSCKGLSASACEHDAACSWVAGYTTKKGVQVEAYCRLKRGAAGGASESGRNTADKEKPKG